MVVLENYLSVSSHALTMCVLNHNLFPVETTTLHAECILKISVFSFLMATYGLPKFSPQVKK